MIEVALTSPAHRTRTIKGLFDSGADFTHLDPQWKAKLRIRDADCIPWDVRVANGTTSPGELTVLDAAIGADKFRMPVVFFPNVPTDLFGRVGIFDRFHVQTDAVKMITTLTWCGQGNPWAESLEAHWKAELQKKAKPAGP